MDRFEWFFQGFDLNHARRTLEKPWPSSMHISAYSAMWQYDVECHPDSFRGTTPFYLHHAILQFLVAMVLVQLLRIRNEFTILRAIVFMLAPPTTYIFLCFPYVVILCCMFSSLISNLRQLNRDRGIYLGIKQAWSNVQNGLGRCFDEACGPLMGIVEQDLPFQANQADIGAKPAETIRSNSPTVFTITLLVGLTYLSLSTIILCRRRTQFEAELVIDKYLYHLGKIGFLAAIQLILIYLLNPQPVNAVNVLQKDCQQPEVEASKSTNSADVVNKPSMTLICRSVTAGYPRPDNHNDFPYTLGSMSIVDVFYAVIIFNQISFFAIEDTNENGQGLYYQIVHSYSRHFFILGFVSFYVGVLSIISTAVISLFQSIIKKINPNSEYIERSERVRQKYSTLPTKLLGGLISKLRIPDSVRWFYNNCYFSLWALIFYPTMMWLMQRDVSLLKENRYGIPTNFACNYLWWDPLAEILLWPIYRWRGDMYSE